MENVNYIIIYFLIIVYCSIVLSSLDMNSSEFKKSGICFHLYI